jgi:iron complex transport system ATP-binding protein
MTAQPGFMLEAEGVRFSYGEVRALDGFSLAVEGGSLVGMVGPNGSGKSTFVRVVSKVVRPQGGRICLGGQDLRGLSQWEVARWVAVAPQRVELGFDMGVREFVSLGRLPYLRRFGGETRRDVERVEEAMAATEVLELQGRRMEELSGGERQRAILAKALAQEPKVLVLDEPTTHLDIRHQMEVLRLVRRLNRERGVTVLAILHDVNLAAQFCDEIAVVKGGKVLRSGPTGQVMMREVLEEAFGVELMVREDVVGGRPFVVPLEPAEGRENRQGKRVHVVCGGGTGFRLMEELSAMGIRVTAGVLNVGDTDYLVAKRLGIEVAEEAAFREISEESARRCLEMMKEAEVMVVTGVPFGPGNVRNLEVLLESLEWKAQKGEGAAKVLVRAEGIGERDFSGGKAERLMKELVARGAAPVPEEVRECLAAVLASLETGQQESEPSRANTSR